MDSNVTEPESFWVWNACNDSLPSHLICISKIQIIFNLKHKSMFQTWNMLFVPNHEFKSICGCKWAPTSTCAAHTAAGVLLLLLRRRTKPWQKGRITFLHFGNCTDCQPRSLEDWFFSARLTVSHAVLEVCLCFLNKMSNVWHISNI